MHSNKRRNVHWKYENPPYNYWHQKQLNMTNSIEWSHRSRQMTWFFQTMTLMIINSVHLNSFRLLILYLTNSYLIPFFSNNLICLCTRKWIYRALFCVFIVERKMHLRSIARHRTVLSTSLRILQSYTPTVSSRGKPALIFKDHLF